MIASGSKVRFQVDTGLELFGHSWLVTSKTNSSNLYISNSFASDGVHISHHASGQWHVTFPSKVPSKGSEHLAITTSRNAFLPDWYHASRIVVMREDAVLTENDSNAIKVPFHPDYLGICVDFFISEKTALPFKLDLAFPIATMELGNTHQVEIVARPYSVTESAHKVFSEEILETQKVLGNLGWQGDLSSFILICDTENDFGFLQQIELRIPTPSSSLGAK